MVYLNSLDRIKYKTNLSAINNGFIYNLNLIINIKNTN